MSSGSLSDLAFIFPGQGAQQPEIGHHWVDCHSWSLVEPLSDWLAADVEYLLLRATSQELAITLNTQKALFAITAIILSEIFERFPRPQVVAGHSQGEFGALLAAGRFDVQTAAKMVRARAEATAAAASQQAGAMVAVLGGDQETLLESLASIDGVWLANDNCPGQQVYSMRAEVRDRFDELARAHGARTRALKIEGAFHSPLMQSAVEPFRMAIEPLPIADSEVEFVTNFNGSIANGDPNHLKDLLAGQLINPVRWTQCQHTIAAIGPSRVIEVGPGRTLSGLAKRTIPNVEVSNLDSPAQLLQLGDLLKSK